MIRRALNDYNHPGVPPFNRLRPDLVDFGSYEVYEIKSSNELTRGLGELAAYLTLLNGVSEMPQHWLPGNTFTPPPFIVTKSSDIVWVHPPILGVVTYDIISDWIDAAAATAAYITIQRITSELIPQLALAAFNASRGAW
ncbi:hypothetical protein AB3R30_20155 [Leptolyngbyaceae cyanobacterium UHCC 1019]